MKNNKRSRSNAKANIWDIQVTNEEIIRFLTVVAQNLNFYNIELDENINLNRRRNATSNIWNLFTQN
jgi:hypothetical protein